jgi:hypothetical protein
MFFGLSSICTTPLGQIKSYVVGDALSFVSDFVSSVFFNACSVPFDESQASLNQNLRETMCSYHIFLKWNCSFSEHYVIRHLWVHVCLTFLFFILGKLPVRCYGSINFELFYFIPYSRFPSKFKSLTNNSNPIIAEPHEFFPTPSIVLPLRWHRVQFHQAR